MSNKLQVQKTVSISECDPKGRRRPSAFLIDMQELAEMHVASLGLPRHYLIENGMIWILYRQRLVMNAYPTFDEVIVENTWPGPVEGPVFPRHFTFERPDGTRLGEAVSSWVLINLATRRPMRPTALPKPLPDFQSEASLPLPAMLRIEDAEPMGGRIVRYTDLDVNGHMNNTRYIDWVCDILPLTPLLENGLGEIQVNYIAEGLPGEAISLFTKTEGNATLVQGTRADGKAIFEARAVIGQGNAH